MRDGSLSACQACKLCVHARLLACAVFALPWGSGMAIMCVMIHPILGTFGCRQAGSLSAVHSLGADAAGACTRAGKFTFVACLYQRHASQAFHIAADHSVPHSKKTAALQSTIQRVHPALPKELYIVTSSLISANPSKLSIYDLLLSSSIKISGGL